ncbi:MAG: host-nuclease inhibitor Gam family protein [Rhodocyclaceae bacterium]|nr:host-nuclease inhibitor Gam family protein [Rhodocyclaceae bacterium]
MKPQKTRLKQPAVAVAVPASAAEVSAAIARIGGEQRELARIEAGMNDALAEVKEHWETIAEPHRKRIADTTQGVQVWCEAHRGELLKGDAKTAAFPAGEVQWRVRPPRCVVRGAEAVLDTLRRLGLSRFIRSKDEINKDAILNEPEAVRGVAGIGIEQGEDFVIKPFEAPLTEAA